MHRMITIHARPKQTNGQTDRLRQTDKHHDNSVTIRSNERITREKLYDRLRKRQ